MTDQEIIWLSETRVYSYSEINGLHDRLLPEDQTEVVIRGLLRITSPGLGGIPYLHKLIDLCEGRSIKPLLKDVVPGIEFQIASEKLEREVFLLFWKIAKRPFTFLGLQLKEKYRRYVQ